MRSKKIVQKCSKAFYSKSLLKLYMVYVLGLWGFGTYFSVDKNYPIFRSENRQKTILCFPKYIILGFCLNVSKDKFGT